MTYQTRNIISNILLFLEAILLFSIIILFSFKLAFNKNTVIKKMDKTNYYENLYNETLDNMKYIKKKSGFYPIILEETFNIEDIKRDSNKYVESIFKNEKIEINIETLKENIETNLDEYLKEKDIEIESTKKSEYINKITTTYKNEIRLMKQYNEIGKDINRYNKLSSTLLILFIIDLVILLIINKKIFNKKEYYILFFTSALSLLITNICISKILKQLYIYNNSITDVLKLVIKKGIHINLLFVIILLGLGILTNKYIKEEKIEIYE